MENFGSAKALFFEGLAHIEREEYAQAETKLAESLNQAPERVSTLTNLSLVSIRLGKTAAAKDFSLKALALDAGATDAWMNLGLIELQSEAPARALECFGKVIALEPEYAAAWRNQGLACQALECHADALAAFRQAVALNADDAEAHFGCGCALRELERPDEALAAHARAVALRPDYASAHYQIFSLRLATLSDADRLEQLGRDIAAANLQRGIDELRTRKTMSDFHVLHELEQTDYLLALGHDGTALRAANSRLREIYAAALAKQGHSEHTRIIELDDEAIADIVRYRRQAPIYQVPLLRGDYLNPDNDWRAIEEQYFDSKPEMVAIDNLLSPQALAELRKFCLVSAVWNKDYLKQYLGAFPDDGFVSALHVRIGAELRQKMPRVFGPHRLEQLWGFKYTSKMGGGINVHADFARVNLNFWITPDEANLDPDSGGLVVYDAPCPPSWGFKEYNRDDEAIYAFLKECGARSTSVPYRCNRAVLFNSNLFHETDRIDFKPGYENRRINITYLFGKGLKTQ